MSQEPTGARVGLYFFSLLTQGVITESSHCPGMVKIFTLNTWDNLDIGGRFAIAAKYIQPLITRILQALPHHDHRFAHITQFLELKDADIVLFHGCARDQFFFRAERDKLTDIPAEVSLSPSDFVAFLRELYEEHVLLNRAQRHEELDTDTMVKALHCLR